MCVHINLTIYLYAYICTHTHKLELLDGGGDIFVPQLLIGSLEARRQRNCRCWAIRSSAFKAHSHFLTADSNKGSSKTREQPQWWWWPQQGVRAQMSENNDKLIISIIEIKHWRKEVAFNKHYLVGNVYRVLKCEQLHWIDRSKQANSWKKIK